MSLLAVAAFCSTSAAQLGRGAAAGGAPSFNNVRDQRRSTAPVFNPTGQTRTVVDVKIKGNRSTGRAKIESMLRTRQDRAFDPELLQADVRRLELSGLFRSVRSYVDPVPGGVSVTIEVFELPTIGYVHYVGNLSMSDRAINKIVDLEVGEALNRYNVEEGRRKIEEKYKESGFADVRVEIREGINPDDGGVVYVIGEGVKQRIWDVEFVGNTIASDARLKTQIESKPGYLKYFIRGQLDERKVNEDIDRLTAYYRGLGFFQAKIGREVKLHESGKWATVTFFINEGPRYRLRNVSFAGNGKFASADLTTVLELRPGDYFNAAEMKKDVQMLTDVYGSQGHIFADVQADPRFLEQPGELDLVYSIEEGEVYRVGQINIHIGGEYPHTRRTVVMNRLSLRPGDIIDVRQMRASERRLKASQLFETDPTRGDEPRIIVKPSENGPTYRGQSPEAHPRGPAGPRYYR